MAVSLSRSCYNPPTHAIYLLFSLFIVYSFYSWFFILFVGSLYLILFFYASTNVKAKISESIFRAGNYTSTQSFILDVRL